MLFYFLNSYFGFELLHNITFDSICNIFSSLGTNQYPNEFTDANKLIEFGILLLFIYFFSGVSGAFGHYIVRILRFDVNFSTLKFNNEWLYLIEANKLNGIKRKRFDDYLTFIDILVLHKDKEELYRGVYKGFIFDKENKLENIILSNASKFIPIIKEENEPKIEALKNLAETKPEQYSVHNDFPDKIIFKKNIEGNLLVVPAENILNVNLTYVNYFNRYNSSRITLLRLMYFLLFICFAILFLIPFIKIDNFYIKSFWSKTAFAITTSFVLIFIFGVLKDVIISAPGLKKKAIQGIVFVIHFSIFYLGIFDILSVGTTILVFIGTILIMGLITQKSESKR
ncbi:hypothetical protein CHU92_01465 [Flavobacterium cyanobacteriorum]|uniref:Uncharacterized protein n=1 Tax=Flavobacterium cyanobacteriorum TaxID=2022802 RepID=A0A256A033_9FLAO|nr:hypothetical protein CHU92_01465 [Flavobacterium cyanobacteriorum]